MTKRGVTWLAAAIVAAGILADGAARADETADFYRDKRIRVIAAAGAGGGFGLRARLLSEYLGRHVPGNPTAIAEFMPGAGGRKAADYIYSVAPKDGTTFGVLFNNTASVSVLRPEGTRYDPLKFTWLGSQSPTVIAAYVWHRAPAVTLADIRQRETIFGTQAKGSAGYMLPSAANAITGTRFKMVTGYTGTADYLKAIESGEIHAALADWDSILSVRGDWVKSRTIIPVLQFGLEKHPTLPDVPRLIELAKTDTERKIAEIEGLVEAMGHTNVGPPAIPPARVAALRASIAATYRDADFKRAAERARMTVDPVSAADVEKYVKQIVATPPNLIARARVVFAME